MSDVATVSERTLHWFGDKTRDELLAEIDRIITTDKPALANLYERHDLLRDALRRIAFGNWTSGWDMQQYARQRLGVLDAS